MPQMPCDGEEPTTKDGEEPMKDVFTSTLRWLSLGPKICTAYEGSDS